MQEELLSLVFTLLQLLLPVPLLLLLPLLPLVLTLELFPPVLPKLLLLGSKGCCAAEEADERSAGPSTSPASTAPALTSAANSSKPTSEDAVSRASMRYTCRLSKVTNM
jgi:hypothetical protein